MLKAESLQTTGLILAGGRGTRLHPLTAETSKQLLPVGDKPLVLYAVENLLRAGIKDILLLIDDRHASQFMQLLHDGSHLGVRSLSYIWQPQEGKGLPSAIGRAENFVKDGKLVVVCGDVIAENGISTPVESFRRQRSGARLVGVEVPDTAGYSPLITRGGKVLNILPKDKGRHQAGLIDLGIYMYHPDVFGIIPELPVSPRGETEIWDLNRRYIEKGQLRYTVVDGWWSDVGGSIKNYFEAHERYATH